jgi:hypothetical protein
MPVTAICRATGRTVESFSVSDAEWAAMRANKDGYLMRRTQRPAVLRENRHGTRWFQSKPGERDPDYRPESAAHEMTKIWIVQALREAGYAAEVEQFGVTPEGERWEADAYVEVGDKRIAIEVQLSPQPLTEYIYRSERYARSGVKVVWLVQHFQQFSIEAAISKGLKGGAGIAPDLFHVPAVAIRLRCSPDEPRQEAITIELRHVGKRHVEPITLKEFSLGIVRQQLTFKNREFWAWSAAPTPAIG